MDDFRCPSGYDYRTGEIEMIEKIAVETERQCKVAEEVREAYSSRIEELRGYALEDEIEIREESERDFWEFVNSTSSTNKAGLFLLENGNFRAVWKDGNGGHVAIQFLGDGQTECVIFKPREDSRFIARMAGHDTLNGVKRQILAFDLESLVGV